METIRTFGGAVALITGAASGLGRALAIELARRGAALDLADVDEAGLEESARLVRALGREAFPAKLDVRDAGAVERWVAGAAERGGRLDYLFNNAGIGGPAGLAERFAPADWDPVIDVNLRGVVNGVHAAYPRMARQGFGHIVNTASVAGLLPFPLAAPYCATKHAVVGLSKSLRYQAERKGVRVSALCPGVVRTPLLLGGKFKTARPIPDERVLEWWSRFRPIEPERFAREALDLVARNRPVIVVPAMARWAVRLCRWLPFFEDFLERLDLRRTLRTFPEVYE